MLWSTDSSRRNSVRIDRPVRKDWIFIASDFDESSISRGHFDEFPLKVELEAELVASRSSDVDDFNRVAVEHAFDLISAAGKFNLENYLEVGENLWPAVNKFESVN